MSTYLDSCFFIIFTSSLTSNKTYFPCPDNYLYLFLYSLTKETLTFSQNTNTLLCMVVLLEILITITIWGVYVYICITLIKETSLFLPGINPLQKLTPAVYGCLTWKLQSVVYLLARPINEN